MLEECSKVLQLLPLTSMTLNVKGQLSSTSTWAFSLQGALPCVSKELEPQKIGALHNFCQ